MSTITLPNIRVSSDLTVKLKLKDGGVAIDWSTLQNIKVSIYSDAQRALAGRCGVSIDAEDPTLLVCTYAANKPQYVGVNRVVVSAKYMGETKTYDKPALNFVRWTDDQAGEQITIDDPDIDVEISVEDISSSILQEAVDAAFIAADRANDAAEAAEHMVDIHTGPKGDKGDKGDTGEKGDTGDAAGFGTVSAALQEDGGDPSVVVAASGPDTAKQFDFTFKNLKGDKGDKGVVNNLTDGGSTAALSAEMGKTLEGEVSQLEAKVDSLPRGKDYGFFTSSSLLPSGATEEGFAYVGATEPYAIWQFDGTSWTDSGVTANAFTANPEDVQESVDEYLEDHPTVSGTFLNVAKHKLISLLEKVAFIDEHGQDYIDELSAFLFLSPIDHIDAVFTQGSSVIYDIYDLDDLKSKLVVTVYYVDGSHAVVSDYELSGTLVGGTSTITVSVLDSVTGNTFTDTFNVTVTATTKLYVSGDECSALTGGWQNKGFNNTNGSPTVAKEASDLLIRFGTSSSSAAAKTWSTVNKIDITGKTQILIQYEMYNETGSAGFYAYYPGTLSESTSQSGAFGSDYSSNRSGIRVLPNSGTTFESQYRLRSITATRTNAYISLNLNCYSADGAQYSAGAYVKIKKVALV